MAFLERGGRIDLEAPIVVGLEGVRINAKTRNIGLGGAFVAMNRLAFVGQHVSLELDLPSLDVPLFAVGEVRWVRAIADGNRAAGIGVKFVKLPLYMVAVLDNLVRAHAGQP